MAPACVVLRNFKCRGSPRFQQSFKDVRFLGCVLPRLTMCELNCYIYRVPRVILAFLYAVGFTVCGFCATGLLKAVKPLRYTSSDIAKIALAEAPCAYFHPLEGYAGRC
jgi:hypothetical protein